MLSAAGVRAVKSHQTDVILRAPDAVFRIWHFREQIEIEAASVFQKLGQHLSVLWGKDDHVAQLAFLASSDELRHQKLCRAILNHSPVEIAPARSGLDIALGPRNLPLRERALYAAVAMGCVTETLSSALLLEMQRRASPGIIKDTVHSILKDEITHARIGWAELARAKRYGAIDWLNDYLNSMVAAAFASDIEPMLNPEGKNLDLSEFGILRRNDALTIMKKAVSEVIIPGLEAFGLKTNDLSP